jgi:hypothetical protein
MDFSICILRRLTPTKFAAAAVPAPKTESPEKRCDINSRAVKILISELHCGGTGLVDESMPDHTKPPYEPATVSVRGILGANTIQKYELGAICGHMPATGTYMRANKVRHPDTSTHYTSAHCLSIPVTTCSSTLSAATENMNLEV